MKHPAVTLATAAGPVRAIAPLVLSASRATDLPAFHVDWFLDRLAAGFCEWRNPFNGKVQIVSFARARAAVFWSVAPFRISSFPLDHYWEDSAILDYLYRQAKNYPNLILDIRGNGGGSDRYWQDLIVAPNAKELARSQRYFLFQDSGLVRAYREANGIPAQPLTSESPAPLNRYLGQFSHYTADVTAFEIASHPYPGKIWVLVDEGVYSAAENFVAFCKNTGFATLVGEATGGDGGIADPILVSLPESGLLLRFSVFYGINADGTGNEAAGTQPDLSVPQGEDALAFLLDQLAEETDAASVPLQGQGQ